MTVYSRERLCGLVVRVPGYRSRCPRIRFPALPGFVGSSGSRTGPTQPREYNWGINSRGSGLEIQEYNREDPLRWPRDTICPQRLALSLPTGCCRSVDIVHSRT
jgi:hypothetical protein